MDARAIAEVEAHVDAVLAALEDLTTYPRWLSFVLSVRSEESPSSRAGQPGWLVDLGTKVGLFTRSKRVRIVRSAPSRPGRVGFERRELDGRPHSPWVLTVDAASIPQGGTRIEGHLHYGGSVWVPGVDRLVRRELEAAGSRLDRLISEAH